MVTTTTIRRREATPAPINILFSSKGDMPVPPSEEMGRRVKEEEIRGGVEENTEERGAERRRRRRRRRGGEERMAGKGTVR